MLVSAVPQCESAVSTYKIPPSQASLPSPDPTPLGHHGAQSWVPCALGTTSYFIHGSVFMSKTLSQFVPWVGPFSICLWHSTPFISFTVLVTDWSVALFTFHSLPHWNISPIWTANVPALLAGSFCSRCLHPATLYLAKAAFSQHHQEVKISQFHPVPVAVVVKFGDGVGRLFFRGLGPRADLGSLEGEAHRKYHQNLRTPVLSVQTPARRQAVDPAIYTPTRWKARPVSTVQTQNVKARLGTSIFLLSLVSHPPPETGIASSQLSREFLLPSITTCHQLSPGQPTLAPSTLGFTCSSCDFHGLPCSSDSKECASNAGRSGLIPGSALQCSGLENSKDRGAWRATVHGVARSWTRLSG